MSDSAAHLFSAFKNALRPQGQLMVLPDISPKSNVYVRKCYELLFDDILDLVSLGFTFIHVSGNPGIGKSCFLWYVLTRFLKEEQGKAVIVQLVEKLKIRTYVFTPEGTVEEVDSPEMSSYYKQDGTWLLTDQKYVGSHARAGVTVLFASPKVENWDEARRNLDESRFKRLYMRPWSVRELEAVFFEKNPREPRYYREFWVRYYIAGPIARWYFIPVKDAFSELSDALRNVVKLGTVDAALFHGVMDNGQHSHKIFCAWPSDDFTEVSQFTFISEWTELSFAVACYRGSLGNWMTSIKALASDPQLRSAAGTLFERYAHYRLSRGGVFPSSEHSDTNLELESTGLSLVEDMDEPEEKQVPGAPRKRRRYVSTVKQEKAAPALKATQKKTCVQFQVLGEDEVAAVDYEKQLREVYNTVRSRMVGCDDPGHLRSKDYTGHELDSDEVVHLLMRRGRSSKQYKEFEGDLCVFGVWIEALRSQAEDGMYTTVVNMECTVGTFSDEDREIEVFIDERVGSELLYDDPLVLDVVPGFDAEDTVTARLLSETLVNVAIVSARRECKYFRLRIHKS